jgi:hypothetical protein
MTISPKHCLVIVASVFAIKASAQKSTINKDTNGKLLYSYNKTIDNNNTSFDVRIIYKKDQVIYKEEMDSVVLHSQAELNDFASSLQKVIESLPNDKANPVFEKPTYTLLKTDKGMGGIFVSISNHTGTIVANNTKPQALDLLEWIKSITFGKE